MVQLALIGGCERDQTQSPSQSSATPAALKTTVPELQWLTDITDDTGLSFVHESGAEGHYFTPEITGSGCALFDYNNDGRLDAYLINGNLSLASASHAHKPTNRLFRQEENGAFVDVTESSGLGDEGYGMGVAVGDIDNDGDLDVFVTNLEADQLYRNNGDGTFENITVTAGAAVDGWSSSAGFLDYNRDGWLDLFVVRYLDFNTVKRCFDAAGRPDYCAPNQFPPLSDVLLRNNGDGTFTDVSAEAGISALPQRGLGIACADFNDDGWIDIYVANDGDPNQLWINQQDGTFHELAVMAGAAFDIHGRPQAGMGVVATDFNDDGLIDVFVTNFSGETNTMYVNKGGDQGFEDHTAASGLVAGCIDYTGFGAEAIDIELDGDLDLAIVNGATLRESPHPNALPAPPWNHYAEPNLLYVNEGLMAYEPNCAPFHAFCDQVEISRGLVAGDIDNDGDMDLLVSNMQGPARLLRNDSPRAADGAHWLTVRCVDPQLNRDALGATVVAHIGDRRVTRTITSIGSCMSACQPLVHIGLGPHASVDALEVRWPDGVTERFDGCAADRRIELVRGTGRSQ